MTKTDDINSSIGKFDDSIRVNGISARLSDSTSKMFAHTSKSTEGSSKTNDIKLNIRRAIEITNSEPEKQFCCFMKQSHLDLLTVFLAEILGTGLLVFLGCMGCVDGYGFKPSHLTICLGFGLAVMLIINIFGMVSGAHLNPAVSIAAVIYKFIDIPTFIVYTIGQLLGGFLGYGLLRLITPAQFFEGSNSFCVSLPSADPMTAFVVEFIITSVLILVCCGCWDPRNAKHLDSLPLRFGLTVSCLALVGGPYSGGSMNPARSFGPALYNGNWTSHWIYWVAPISAAIITSYSFKLIFTKEAPKAVEEYEDTPLRDRKNLV